ncbi:hypothetical protein EUGRSUZ_L00321 [Eucalyptus grandis]|uniref:Protein kinase domain-containing protein n=1 Tax=Eucalyptus grandis TaxID=71139 RepID=A0A058ZVN9_EUCGR|nr:hypothetical protein EUGRSUZ_L00321 [Eucalyptus grandis]
MKSLKDVSLVKKSQKRIMMILSFTLLNLEGIYLSYNHLIGPIPESISNASDLSEFEILMNNFTGKVPSFSKMRGLYWFYIDGNNFGRGQCADLDFLCSLTNSTNLDGLAIDNNAFQGPIPNCICNLSITLSELWLSFNHISGSLPSKIGNLINLEVLTMGDNKISGNIPSEIGNLNKMKHLNLHLNKFYGQIPESLGNLGMLIKLSLNNNNLQGSIPSSLGNCQNLLLLDRSTNNLSGNIPPEIVNLTSLSIFLNLSQNSLTGSLPREVGNLKNLGELRLNNNRLSQEIPSSIGSCLQLLNVSNNRLFGQIPKYLESLNLTNLSLSYNNFEGALPTGGVFQISTLVGVAYILYLLFFFRYRHNKTASLSSSPEEGLLHVSYHNLLKATAGFSSTNLLGVGSFGSVYRGLLDQNQSIVAIKILDLTLHEASKSFIAECGAWRRIRHRNLVKVLTACSRFDFNGNDFKAFVYEFMSNESLDEWLHPSASQYTERRRLSLLERVNIAIDVACALDYLHHHCETPIVHCDLKPSNVLLDDEKTGHVGDFGACQYGIRSVAATEGDVYSFGVLILEMFTGKRPIDDMFENGLDLYRFAKGALANQVERAIDPVLLQEIKQSDMKRIVTLDGKNKSWCSILECLVSILKIGVTSSSESPRERMDISNVLSKLQGIKKNLLEFIVIA